MGVCFMAFYWQGAVAASQPEGGILSRPDFYTYADRLNSRRSNESINY